MPIYGGAAVHQDVALANMALAYKQSSQAFIAHRIFPEVAVQKQTDKYYTWDRDAFLRSQAAPRAPGSEVTMRQMALSKDSYACEQYAIGDFVTYEDLQNADAALQLVASTTEGVMADMMIRRDNDFVATYMKTSVWGLDMTGVASATPSAGEFTYWDDFANSNPKRDIRAAATAIQLRTGIRPNRILIDQLTLDAWMEHPIFRPPSAGFSQPDPTLDYIARLIGVDQVVVSGAIQVTSPLGASTMTTAFLMAKKALLVYAAPSPGLRVATGGMIFNWTGLFERIGASTEGIVVRRLDQEKRLREDIEAFMAYDHKVTGAELGVFFDGTIS